MFLKKNERSLGLIDINYATMCIADSPDEVSFMEEEETTSGRTWVADP